MRFHHSLITLCLAGAVTAVNAASGPGFVPGLDGSTLSMLSGLVTISTPIVSPFIVLDSVIEDSQRPDRVAVVGHNQDGSKVEMSIPKEVATKAGLKAGDQLTAQPYESGALLKKGEVAIAYAVKPELANLSSNQALKVPAP